MKMKDEDRENRERRLMYREHRWRVANAKSIVNSYPPKPKLTEQSRNLTLVDLMSSMYSRANNRTFTQSPLRLRTSISLNTANSRQQQQLLDVDDDYYDNDNDDDDDDDDDGEIVSPKSAREATFRKKKNHQVNRQQRSRSSNTYNIPDSVKQRYQNMGFLDANLIGKLLRPKIFFDIAFRNGSRSFGRIIIQLFTEACPEIVMQFVRICSLRYEGRFQFTRIFPQLWMEGEFHLDENNYLSTPNVEHDPNAIDHGSGPGIVSFPSRYLRGSKYRFISFTISFKPLKVLNGKRIAFGRLHRGQQILDVLQGVNLMRNNRPIQDIVVTSCGLI